MSKKKGNDSFSIGVPALQSALDFVSNAAERKPTLPILATVLFVIADGKLRLFATDLDRWAIATVSITQSAFAAEFKFGVNLLKLKAWVGTLKGTGELSVSLTESNATFEFGAAKARLATIKAENFPELAETDISLFSVSPETLQLFGQVKPFCDSMDGRFMLSAVSLKLQKKKLVITATDGKHLTQLVTDPEDLSSKDDATFMIPSIALPLLTAIGEKVKVANVGLTSSNLFAVWDSKYFVACRMPTGNFPDVSVLMNEKPLRFVADGDALKRALSVIAPAVAPPKSNQSYVKVTVKEGEATVTTSDDFGEYGGYTNITDAIVACQQDFEAQLNLSFLQHVMAVTPEGCENSIQAGSG